MKFFVVADFLSGAAMVTVAAAAWSTTLRGILGFRSDSRSTFLEQQLIMETNPTTPGPPRKGPQMIARS